MKRTSRSTILTGRMTASKPTKTGTTLLAAAPQSAKEPAIICVIAYQKRAGIGGAGCQFTSSHPDQVWSNLFLAEGCVRPPRCHDAGECVARFQLHHVCVSRLDDQWGMRNSSLPRRVGTLLPLTPRAGTPPQIRPDGRRQVVFIRRLRIKQGNSPAGAVSCLLH